MKNNNVSANGNKVEMTNGDLYFSEEGITKIEKSLLQAKNGEITKVIGKDTLIEFLKSL